LSNALYSTIFEDTKEITLCFASILSVLDCHHQTMFLLSDAVTMDVALNRAFKGKTEFLFADALQASGLQFYNPSTPESHHEQVEDFVTDLQFGTFITQANMQRTPVIGVLSMEPPQERKKNTLVLRNVSIDYLQENEAEIMKLKPLLEARAKTIELDPSIRKKILALVRTLRLLGYTPENAIASAFKMLKKMFPKIDMEEFAKLLTKSIKEQTKLITGPAKSKTFRSKALVNKETFIEPIKEKPIVNKRKGKGRPACMTIDEDEGGLAVVMDQ
jgi:hypothetical protein